MSSTCVHVPQYRFVLFAGFLVDLISTPVTSGFTTATSIIIVLSQLKGILGLTFKGDTVKDIIEKLIEHFHERRNGDIYLGLGAIAFILIMRVRQWSLCCNQTDIQSGVSLIRTRYNPKTAVIRTGLIASLYLETYCSEDSRDNN